MKNPRVKTKKLTRFPKSETDYVWVAPGTELAKKGDYTPGTGVYIKGNKIYAERFGFVNIDRKKVIRIVPLAGG
jgi:exosome complex RNA-binding protein Rrp4